MATHSAVSAAYPYSGILQSEGYADLLDASFDVMKMKKDAIPLQGDRFFKPISTGGKATWKTGYVTSDLGVPVKNTDTEEMPYAQPAPGFDITYTPDDFRLAIRITREMREKDRYDQVMAMQGGLMDAFRQLDELKMAAVFNSAFATNLGADGMYMCDTGHPCEDGIGGTWNNLQTPAALSQASLRLMRLAMLNRKSPKGYLRTVEMKTLVVPSELEDKAKELLGSSLRAEDSMNAINVYKGGFKLERWDYLTDENAFFGLGAMDEQYEVFKVTRVEPSLESWKPTPDIFAQRLRFSFVMGFGIPRQIEGNAGA